MTPSRGATRASGTIIHVDNSKGQYSNGARASPNFGRYADVVSQGLLALDYPCAERPVMFLEAT